MLAGILQAIWLVIALIIDIVTLPFRVLFALLRGADWELHWLGGRRRP